ncbi:hypothetical protein [Vallitalea maricola]|uniref:Uncharacterized protein n=1 Tax=Vallitalea maricola TaxID=3074433 RepID=A0ACB5UHM1_9FIRM|nr:hypothetical protein AN2V17_11860 [Vallitalea sp. AN17-2]
MTVKIYNNIRRIESNEISLQGFYVVFQLFRLIGEYDMNENKILDYALQLMSKKSVAVAYEYL